MKHIIESGNRIRYKDEVYVVENTYYFNSETIHYARKLGSTDIVRNIKPGTYEILPPLPLELWKDKVIDEHMIVNPNAYINTWDAITGHHKSYWCRSVYPPFERMECSAEHFHRSSRMLLTFYRLVGWVSVSPEPIRMSGSSEVHSFQINVEDAFSYLEFQGE